MPRSRASQPKYRRNQHRWKASLAEHTVRDLEAIAEDIKRAWAADMQSPEYYPMNTDDAFRRGMEWFRGEAQIRTGPVKIKLPPPPPPPRSLTDLFDETAVKAVYEDQNSGRYEDALVQAVSGDWGKAQSAFQKIMRAIQAAYDIGLYGYQAIPKPRVHFLHRSLLELADLVEVADLSHNGIREFFDDLCPCGDEHNPEAIRKLRKRTLARTQAKSEPKVEPK